MEYVDEDTLGIYTDGSSYQGPRRGGVGVLFVTLDDAGDEVVDEVPLLGYRDASNNQMELQACVEALRIAMSQRPPVDPSRYRRIMIFTDSRYVTENFARAKFQWSSSGWKKSTGAPVLNAPLWKELLRLVRRAGQHGKHVDIEWVKGHKASPHNRRVDKLAKVSARTPSRGPVAHVRLRRKLSPESVDPGSVGMRGQRLTIRVISDEYLRVQRLNRYRYEVMSKRSPYYQKVDFICSETRISLSRGHTYHVRVNEDQGNPMIVSCFREIS